MELGVRSQGWDRTGGGTNPARPRGGPGNDPPGTGRARALPLGEKLLRAVTFPPVCAAAAPNPAP